MDLLLINMCTDGFRNLPSPAVMSSEDEAGLTIAQRCKALLNNFRRVVAVGRAKPACQKLAGKFPPKAGVFGSLVGDSGNSAGPGNEF